MNILILNWRDIKHPLAGGAEQSLFEHAKKWNKNGANVTWFSSAFSKSHKKEKIEGIEFIRAGNQYTVHLNAFIFFLSGKLGNPDIVIDSFHFLPFFSSLYIFKAKKIALINEVAGKLWFSNIIFPVSVIGFLLEKISFNFYKNYIFITASRSTEKELIKIGINKKRIFTVLNGVTTTRSKKKTAKSKNPSVLFLGRISADKGIDDAFKSFNLISEKVNDVKFLIAGKEEKKGLLAMLKKKYFKANKKSIEYFGFVTEAKKFELLSLSWILVHPSMKEGWGLNVIEAATQATPTVGYNVEGLRDSIIDKKTGILASPNFESLAEEVVKVINDNKLRKQLSENALKWSKKFSWDTSTNQSWKIISSND